MKAQGGCIGVALLS